jgi:hypothetical protein
MRVTKKKRKAKKPARPKKIVFFLGKEGNIRLEDIRKAVRDVKEARERASRS